MVRNSNSIYYQHTTAAETGGGSLWQAAAEGDLLQRVAVPYSGSLPLNEAR